MSSGFRIRESIPRPSPQLIKGFSNLPVANIADVMNRTSCMNARLRPINTALLLGCAFTVRTRPGDNLMLYKAIDMAEPGDIIVVDAGGSLLNSLMGELMMTWAQKKRVGGFIIDGAIRDYNALRSSSIPIYAAGIMPGGPYKDGPGEINFPISCGGVVVNPGDIIVGDQDGVVVVQPNDAARVLEGANSKKRSEIEIMGDIENLNWDHTWVDKALIAKGCEFVD